MFTFTMYDNPFLGILLLTVLFNTRCDIIFWSSNTCFEIITVMKIYKMLLKPFVDKTTKGRNIEP